MQYGTNRTTDARVGEITLTTVGGAGTTTEVVTFTQVGTQGVSGITTPADDLESLPVLGGTIAVDVTLLGSATGWIATLTGFGTPGGISQLQCNECHGVN